MEKYEIIEKIRKCKECSYFRGKYQQKTFLIKKMHTKNSWHQILQSKEILLFKQHKFQFFPKIKQIIKQNNKFYVVFQNADHNLQDYITTKSHIHNSLKVEITKQLINILHTFNTQLKYILKQIKPEMFFLNNGIIKLIDFKLIQAENLQSQLTKDPIIDYNYEAPQIILGQKLDQKINVFSLGCILSQLFLEQGLIKAKNQIQYFYQYYALFPNEKVGMQQKNNQKFLSFQQKFQDSNSKKYVNLFKNMLKIKPKERFSIQDVKKHFCYNEVVNIDLQQKSKLKSKTQSNKTQSKTKSPKNKKQMPFNYHIKTMPKSNNQMQELKKQKINKKYLKLQEIKKNQFKGKNNDKMKNQKNRIDYIFNLQSEQQQIHPSAPPLQFNIKIKKQKNNQEQFNTQQKKEFNFIRNHQIVCNKSTLNDFQEENQFVLTQFKPIIMPSSYPLSKQDNVCDNVTQGTIIKKQQGKKIQKNNMQKISPQFNQLCLGKNKVQHTNYVNYEGDNGVFCSNLYFRNDEQQ